MSLSQLEQESKFRKHLLEYWNSKGIQQIKIPQIGGQELNLFKLYKAVCKKGGGQAVSHNKLWKEIVDQFGLPSTCTSASFTLKNHYQKYLLGYEQRFFFGKDDSADLPELVAGRQRKPLKDGEGMMVSGRFGGYAQEGAINSSNLASDIKKFYERSDLTQQIHYIKRTKMYPVMAEVKHLILAFQSHDKNEIIYGINMLLLFSMNTEAPFLFSQYPNFLDSVTIYVERVYPPKTVFEWEGLRTLTLAIRNLMINYKNLQPFLESPLIEVFSNRIFEEKLDKEVTRNICDILSSLTRIGWECSNEILKMVEFYLEKQSFEEMETGIDLLRSLVEQKEQLCEEIICSKIDFFARLLIHSSIEVRESICEIFVFLTEKSEKTRLACLTNLKFMERTVALMSNSQGVFERQAELSCLVLNNIAQLHSKEEYKEDLSKHLKKFEKNIALISFDDETLSPITSSILFTMSGRVSDSEPKEADKENMLDKLKKKFGRDQIYSEEEEGSDDEQEEAWQQSEKRSAPIDEREQEEESSK